MTEAQQKVLDSIKQLPDQCLQAWEETKKLEFDSRGDEIWKVVSCGMGASGLPAHIITSAFKTNVPILSVNDYNLPSWVNEHTLVYLSSYSGNTEEVLSCAEQAQKNGCMVTGSTTGGQLGDFFQENNYPAYIFNPQHNPTGQPRMGLGYGLFGQLGILHKLEVVKNGDMDIEVSEGIKKLESEVKDIKEVARAMAGNLQGSVLVVLAAEHLVGNAHVFANQLNETAKTFAAWFSIPEANHHLLEGLKHPAFKAKAIFLESARYGTSISKRFQLTKQVLEKNGIESYYYKPEIDQKFPQDANALPEVLNVLMFSSYVSYYLSEAYNEDPLAIPWVDYFKKELESVI